VPKHGSRAWTAAASYPNAAPASSNFAASVVRCRRDRRAMSAWTAPSCAKQKVRRRHLLVAAVHMRSVACDDRRLPLTVSACLQHEWWCADGCAGGSNCAPVFVCEKASAHLPYGRRLWSSRVASAANCRRAPCDVTPELLAQPCAHPTSVLRESDGARPTLICWRRNCLDNATLKRSCPPSTSVTPPARRSRAGGAVRDGGAATSTAVTAPTGHTMAHRPSIPASTAAAATSP